MKAALYIRVSTDDQANEGYSIEAQKRRLAAHCESCDWEIVDTYIDNGYSAKDTERPELKRLLKEANTGQFDIVVVHKLDRFTRSVKDMYALVEGLAKIGVGFQSVHERFDTSTPMGRAVLGVLSVFAQLEREVISERVRFGMEQMIHEGKRPGAKLPYGYAKDGTVIEEERNILRELRRLYLEGNGFKGVAIQLNQRGLLKRGISWGAYSVYYVLDNPYYAGKIRWGGKKNNGKYASRKKEQLVDCILVDSAHETVYTWEEYVEHTNRMKRRSFNGYTKQREYWFSGVLRCAKCGAAMTGRYHENRRKDGSKHRILSYICANRQMGEGCTMPMFRQELVENLVMEWIANVKIEQEKLEAAKAKSKKEQKRSESELTSLRKELNKVRERKKKWQYMLVEDLITEQEYRQRKAEEEQIEASLSEQLESLEQVAGAVESESVSLMLQLPDLWKVIDDKEKNDLVTAIFKYIELDTPLDRAHGRKGHFIPAFVNRVEYN